MAWSKASGEVAPPVRTVSADSSASAFAVSLVAAGRLAQRQHRHLVRGFGLLAAEKGHTAHARLGESFGQLRQVHQRRGDEVVRLGFDVQLQAEVVGQLVQEGEFAGQQRGMPGLLLRRRIGAGLELHPLRGGLLPLGLQAVVLHAGGHQRRELVVVAIRFGPRGRLRIAPGGCGQRGMLLRAMDDAQHLAGRLDAGLLVMHDAQQAAGLAHVEHEGHQEQQGADKTQEGEFFAEAEIA
jgi:hypothetical protein